MAIFMRGLYVRKRTKSRKTRLVETVDPVVHLVCKPFRPSAGLLSDCSECLLSSVRTCALYIQNVTHATAHLKKLSVRGAGEECSEPYERIR
jgi:hypothetical protein